MEKNQGSYTVFQGGSRTYFTSSLFFPPQVRDEVATLYAFVRVADNYVDATPQDADGFRAFRERYDRARDGERTGDRVVDDFSQLAIRRDFRPEWVEAFLDAMESDLGRQECQSLEETLRYVYGSAEVVGLFMARLLSLRDEALPYAQLLGRAMQYINFIRDVDEDLLLGRRYLPLAGTPLAVLSRPWALAHPEQFRAFVHHHLDLYDAWQLQAAEGFRLIPGALRLPIKTASDMYAWTGRAIRRDPLIVFRRKVKPAKSRIILRALVNTVA